MKPWPDDRNDDCPQRSGDGVAAAYGMVLGAQEINTDQKEEFLADLTRIADRLAQTRTDSE
ncbi:MAG UNVERIFIED_CONTAM: hypothetical protein LVR29_01300 [Microcystis novacekii LVE1205-3]